MYSEQEKEYSFKLEDLAYEANIANLLTDDQNNKIGSQVLQNFNADLESRVVWEKRMEHSMKLALQVAEAKNFPWPNSSNIKFPLVTIAALQFHARAYPALINGDTPVKCRTIGEDPTGEKQRRAERIETHMSYQLMEQDEAWESEMDKALIMAPIIGCAFKKTYFDPIREHNISETVLAKDFVVNYWTKSLDTAPRYTHILYYTKNDLYEREVRGLWKPVGDSRPAAFNDQHGTGSLQAAQNKAQGTQPPQSADSSTPYEILEHYCFYDFDGDGYEEPYIVYVRRDTRKVARIVPRYYESSIKRNKEGKVLSIAAEQCFTKYPFIPSPDGGFYDLGFGVLLGPINESINTIINQLTDAGTMSVTAGGFISRGIKMRAGNNSFTPNEWKHVDTSGDDLRKGILPLPVREPSQVLFTLLNLLINYGERTGGAVDILVGQSPGQNTPAETSRTTAEEGKKVFNGIFKRTYRSLKQEFRKQYRLNQLHISEDMVFISEAAGKGVILEQDYAGSSSDVRPSADPTMTSDTIRLQQAITIQSASQANPGLYNRYVAEKQFLTALKVSDIDRLLPDPQGPNAIPAPGPGEKIQVEMIKAKTAQAEMDLQLKLGLLKLMKDAELAQGKIQKLEAEVAFIGAEIQSIPRDKKINEVQAAIALAKERREGIVSSLGTMTKVFETMKANQPPQEAILPEQPAMTPGIPTP